MTGVLVTVFIRTARIPVVVDAFFVLLQYILVTLFSGMISIFDGESGWPICNVNFTPNRSDCTHEIGAALFYSLWRCSISVQAGPALDSIDSRTGASFEGISRMA